MCLTEFSIPKCAKSVTAALDTQRQRGTGLEVAFVRKLRSAIDIEQYDDDRKICHRLPPELFCIIIDLVLQSDYSTDVERILYILAVILKFLRIRNWLAN
jgi:hypothetical protein